jgi:cytochrome c biogenesis protein CcdA
MASIAFGSVFIGRALPVVGIPAVCPVWGSGLTGAADRDLHREVR